MYILYVIIYTVRNENEALLLSDNSDTKAVRQSVSQNNLELSKVGKTLDILSERLIGHGQYIKSKSFALYPESMNSSLKGEIADSLDDCIQGSARIQALPDGKYQLIDDQRNPLGSSGQFFHITLPSGIDSERELRECVDAISKELGTKLVLKDNGERAPINRDDSELMSTNELIDLSKDEFERRGTQSPIEAFIEKYSFKYQKAYEKKAVSEDASLSIS